MKTLLTSVLSSWNITISDRQLEQFSLYTELLLDWNTRVNLTRITEPDAVVRLHFLDSLALMRKTPDLAGLKLIDIGTGAGFPGIPLKIMNPSMHLTLLDALDKRCRFLQEVVEKLGLNDTPQNGSVTILHGRAEDIGMAGRPGSLRDHFDLVTSRAVAKLNILCEYALPLLKKGGCFAAYKLDDETELTEAANAMHLLHASSAGKIVYTLPDSEPGRAIFLIRKDEATPEKYPRRAGVPEKKPL